MAVLLSIPCFWHVQLGSVGDRFPAFRRKKMFSKDGERLSQREKMEKEYRNRDIRPEAGTNLCYIPSSGSYSIAIGKKIRQNLSQISVEKHSDDWAPPN
jgi:hypothetical protein